MNTKSNKFLRYLLLLILGVALVAIASSVAAEPTAQQGNWWEVIPEEENPSPSYDSILYSEIAPKLREIELNSNRVKVEVIGQSAGGRNLFLVTLSAPEALGRLGQYQAIRNTMLKDPEKAQEMIARFGDFKVPVFVNGSIHGGEYPGVDAAIRLIEKLAYDDSPEVQEILDNVILLVNVVQNPDGRVMGTRSNANGFDINRDFITQSQPESRATVKIFTDWNPMVVLDLHGFVNPMLIEPCTPPHNPNYEYDLYIKWAFYQAEAMEAELFAQTGLGAQIPYRDFDLGWDDWPPTYTPMYAMYHGAYGHTLETSSRASQGVDAHYAAVWGALKFVAQNRAAMVTDQIEIFRRGFLDLPQVLISQDLLDETPFDQFNNLTIQEFPVGYVIPAGQPYQLSTHQAARLVDFLLFNDVEVEQASTSFTYAGETYPAGSYIVWMDQPKRGLANNIMENGPDLSDIPGLYFYSPPSVWSHPLLWGAARVVLEEPVDIKTSPVNKAMAPQGSVERARGAAYAYQPTSLTAFQATNELLARGIELYRTTAAFTDAGRTFGAGTIVFPASSSLVNELVNQYALDLFVLQELPTERVPMHSQRIAVYNDAEVVYVMKTLGFDFDAVSTGDLNNGLISEYDVFVNRGLRWTSLNASGRAAMLDFFAAGGDYVALGFRGRAIDFAVAAGQIDVDYDLADANAVVRIEYDPLDSIAAGYRGNDYAFVYYPLWFTDLGDGVETTATYATEDFMVSGFWPDWSASGAAGMPVIVHKNTETTDVTLIGIDNTFRGHPEHTFGILANAIYDGLD